MSEKFFKAKKSPKKYLSQNFLKSQPALIKIVDAGEIKEGDVVLEIGPGKGALTERLLQTPAQVVAVEKDRELFALLSEKFSKEIETKKLILVEEDILNFEIENLIKNPSYKVIANIPYNITGAILKKFLTAMHQPELMVLLVQKEVGERILARDGKESILSISVKVYGTPSLITKVPKRYFSPSPKVDSVVIKISDISRKNFINSGANEETFWKIVKAGFAHKRKVLSGNLKEVVTAQKLGALSSKRAENIRVFEWLDLSAL